MTFVVTADQRASRSSGDAVPEALASLNGHTRREGLLRRFERTAGDEVQGILSSATLVLELVTTLALTGDWTVGVGIGDVEVPLPRSTRAARGPAFTLARSAVERAGRQRQPVAVEATNAEAGGAAEAAWWLLLALLERRTASGWEAVTMADDGFTYAEIGAKLGVSPSAVGQRLRAAGLLEGRRGAELVAELLARAEAA